MAQSEASKIIERVAREPLLAAGLVRKGRSRMYLDDHGWWVLGVLFESSSYAQASELIVFADFLWRGDDHVALSVGGPMSDVRTPTHHAYLDDDPVAFARGVEEQVRLGLAGLDDLRTRFPTVEAWAAYLTTRRSQDTWRDHHAAVAHGLSGDAAQARRVFRRIAGRRPGPHDAEWDVAARADAERLADLVADRAAFAAEMRGRAQRMRGHLGLPPVESGP